MPSELPSRIVIGDAAAMLSAAHLEAPCQPILRSIQLLRTKLARLDKTGLGEC
jgi:hypothetical protein